MTRSLLHHSRFDEGIPGVVQLAELADICRTHIGVAGQIRSGQARSLAFTCGFHAPLHHFGRFTQTLVG